MKNCYFIMLFFMLNYCINAQVGINTDNPRSTLHVQKRTELTFADGIIPPRISGDSLRLKENAYTPAQNGAIVYVTSAAGTTGPKTAGVNSTGLFIYDATASNGTGNGLWNKLPTTSTPSTGTGEGAYAARVRGNLSVLNLSLTLLSSDANFLVLPETSGTGTNPPNKVDVPTTQLTNIAGAAGDSYYTVPSTGLYQINYSLRTGQGLSLELLGSTRPGIIITKSAPGTAIPLTNTNTETLDYRYYGGVNLVALPGVPIIGGLSLANISLTEGQISHIYNLTAGEQIRFGIVRGGLNLNLLADASAEFSIYRIR